MALDFTGTYLSDMGRSAAPPGPQDAALRRRVLGYYLRGVLPDIGRGPACDLGCGRGDTLLALRALGFEPVRGCDLGTEQVQAARAAGLDVEQKDAEAYLRQVPPQALVAAFDVLEHLEPERGEALLGLAFERLRPGGWLLLQFPNALSPFFGSVHFVDPTHRTVLTPQLVGIKLRRLGFHAVRALETGPVPLSLAGRARNLLWRGVRGALRALDAIETGELHGGPYTRVCLLLAQRP